MRNRRESIVARYLVELRDLPLDLPPQAANGDQHAWHLFIAQVSTAGPINRDEFISRMAESGITCGVHFIPLHRHTYWAKWLRSGEGCFPVADEAFKRVVSLPLFSKMSDEQVERVLARTRKALT